MQVSFSGNSARFSIPKAKRVLRAASPREGARAFKHLSGVQFNSDGTVSIQHDGEMTAGVRTDLRKLGQVLETGEELVAIGIDYTNHQAILVSVSEFGVELLPVIIKPTSEDAFRMRSSFHRLSKVLPLETTWYKTGSRMPQAPSQRLPRQLTQTLGVVDPGNAGYDFYFDDTK